MGQNEAQLAELVEEQADNYLDEDNFHDSKMTDANVKKRIKALDKKTDADEIAVLQKYLDLKGDISLNKKLIKERKYDLLTALVVKYADLSEEEIKRLVIEKNGSHRLPCVLTVRCNASANNSLPRCRLLQSVMPKRSPRLMPI